MTNAHPHAQAPEYKESEREAGARQGMPTPQARQVVPTPQARQGVTGHNVRYVLAFGIAGIVVAFIIVYLIYFG